MSECNRIFPITLGPHGSNLEDVIDTLHGLQILDRGIRATIGGESQHVSAFTMAFLRDISQQQSNSSFKSHQANCGCQLCLVTESERGNLKFEAVLHS